MGEGLGHDHALRLALQRGVADLRRGVPAFFDVAGLDQSKMPGWTDGAE